MDMIADILLVAGAAGAALYCLVLARRLKRLTQLEGGMGSAIAVLSAQVDDLTQALAGARNAAAESTAALEQQTKRAETAMKRMELVMAAMHDLPAPVSHKQPARHADSTVQSVAGADPAAATPYGRDATTPPPGHDESPGPDSRVLPWKSVRQDAAPTREAAPTDSAGPRQRTHAPPVDRDTIEMRFPPPAPGALQDAAAPTRNTELSGADAPPGVAGPGFGTPTDAEGPPVRANRRTRVVRRRAMREAAE